MGQESISSITAACTLAARHPAYLYLPGFLRSRCVLPRQHQPLLHPQQTITTSCLLPICAKVLPTIDQNGRPKASLERHFRRRCSSVEDGQDEHHQQLARSVRAQGQNSFSGQGFPERLAQNVQRRSNVAVDGPRNFGGCPRP